MNHLIALDTLKNVFGPEHTKQLEEVQTEVEGVVYLDGRSNRVLDEVLVDMARIVGEDEV
jgi:hypothetical protein